ncbi:NADH dehydrogenase [ubiquinone] 1 alpha subcomplex assembly factor 4 isoform X2 [Entelurus aequoreus]|uniref:NADH dehydrogenase [ubiquinone] 1 alpha subcomplex assembly factor 4 isoform X2 n=1 Tax=Entelurus aequoreus TaxID=161455 RepID=UPI002B1DE4DB|nr:NADH dehydrogenase [ubiquinone] 1 alpha subcomplex assembly factor 4 isoform X2 [Entelurus aequoreus]
MGSRVGRMFRNVNLENRVQREISKEKPRPAPRHAVTQPTEHDGNVGTVHQKNNDLLSNLKSVYVESINTQTVKYSGHLLVNLFSICLMNNGDCKEESCRWDRCISGGLQQHNQENFEKDSRRASRRPHLDFLRLRAANRIGDRWNAGNSYGLANLTEIPRGKLTITEAIKAVGSHQNEPQTWTSQKIAKEYSLDLKETNSLLEFFIPFQVQILPPVNVKQLKVV